VGNSSTARKLKECHTQCLNEGSLTLQAAEGNLQGQVLPPQFSRSVSENSYFSNRSTVSAAVERSRSVCFQSFFVPDTLHPDANIDICTDLDDPLAELPRAIADLESRGPVSGCSQGETMLGRAVLLHCDMGVNRSPTVALAFLLQKGYSLRSAYRRLQASRPQIDPIAPFRRALRNYEVRLYGSSTVGPAEHFAMHISELVMKVEKEKPDLAEFAEGGDSDSDISDSDDSDSDDDDGLVSSWSFFDEALKLRQAAIKALQQEVP